MKSRDTKPDIEAIENPEWPRSRKGELRKQILINDKGVMMNVVEISMVNVGVIDLCMELGCTHSRYVFCCFSKLLYLIQFGSGTGP